MRTTQKFVLAATALFTFFVPMNLAFAHPHMLAEANLEVGLSADGRTLEKLKHNWRFDDVSSSMFLMDLDTNGDLVLDAAELKEGGKIMLESMAEYNFFQLVSLNGKDIPLNPPTEIFPSWANNQLVITFETTPKMPLPVSGKLDVGIYDPTFYVAIDFLEDNQLQVTNLPASCARQVVRPDADAAIAQNQQTLTEAFFNDPSGNDLGRIFATRLELTCSG